MLYNRKNQREAEIIRQQFKEENWNLIPTCASLFLFIEADMSLVALFFLVDPLKTGCQQSCEDSGVVMSSVEVKCYYLYKDVVLNIFI